MVDVTVVVVGAGLSGLVAAARLAEAGVDVLVIEREDSVGGRVRSREEDGYRLDRGFQVVFDSYPAVRRELDTEALDLRRFAPGAVIARPGRRSVLSDPFRDPATALQSALNRDVTLLDKLRTLGFRWAASRTPPGEITAGSRTIREGLEARGFSRRFVERFAAPFFGGITLDRSLGTSSYVLRYTFAMLSRGSAAIPAEGMGAITRQLATRARDAGARIETDREVEHVTNSAPEVTVTAGDETLAAEAAVIATEPPVARELSGVAAIPTDGRGCVTQYFSLPRDVSPFEDRRLLLNSSTEGPNQVAPLSAVAPEYAPPGRSLISATYLGVPTATDGELADQTRSTVASWFPDLDAGALEAVATDRIRFAQFDQPPGFRDRLPAVTAPGGNVVLAGEYTEWSSIQGALESGREAAAAASEIVGATLRSA